MSDFTSERVPQYHLFVMLIIIIICICMCRFLIDLPLHPIPPPTHKKMSPGWMIVNVL